MNRFNPLRTRRSCLILLVAVEALAGVRAWAYESEIHQQLTFIAARQFNACAQDRAGVERLSALDTRYIVKANVAQADPNMFARMFRWSYYNRDDQTNRSAWGVIDTRFHEHFNDLSTNLQQTEKHEQRLRLLGRLLSYIQKVSSPSYAVPVFSGRWWRFSLGDRFNRFPVDAQAVEQAVAGRCTGLVASGSTYKQVLVDTADETVMAVQAPIFGFPATWESYWRIADRPEEFGEYGRAGNSFGERTEFRCGEQERCLLLNNDPLYSEFATQRHIAAVLATMRALAILQHRQVPLQDPL